MSLFERLLNLDAELTVLGTKAFVAKEEIKGAIRDVKPKRKKVHVEEIEDDEYYDEIEMDESDEESSMADEVKNLFD